MTGSRRLPRRLLSDFLECAEEILSRWYGYLQTLLCLLARLAFSDEPLTALGIRHNVSILSAMTRPYVLPHVGSYHPMIGCLLKIQRAQKHFEELQDTIEAFIGSNPYTVINEPDAKRNHYVARLKIERQPPPELSPVIGDIVHNARSALDHLLWLLVRKAGNDPTDRRVSGRPQFPIFMKDPFDPTLYATTNEWKNVKGAWDSYTRGLDSVDKSIIKRMQPYKSSHNPNLHPLARLNELSNWDKHRELHFAG